MFIIPLSEALLLGAAVVLVLASEQRLIGGTWFRIPRVLRPEGGPGKAGSEVEVKAA
jgi:hypothetical protein